MNASLVALLLLPLFLSNCQGKEEEGFHPSGILSTTKWQKKVEAPLEVSCPDPTDIEPCECTDSGDLTMDCSNVQDEEQLRKVFSAFFPTTEFYKFTMNENHGVKVLEAGVFGDVSFRFSQISMCDLEIVETDALTASFSTLTEISIKLCKLEIFPFERLTDFTSLEFLDLADNKIHTVPPLSSSSLQIISLSHNPTTYLSPDVFTLLENVEFIYLAENHLTEIAIGTFTDLPKLECVDLSFNNISYLQSLTFELVSSSSSTSKLNLANNSIEYVEVDTFKDVAANTTIDMGNNALIRLPEAVWRPVLENITVNLAGNNLSCGCDVAWLVRDPQLLTTVTDVRCADGTLLTDLNPADFDICG